MPATLSMITNVFPPEERGRAISYWAAIAGVGAALGPISGGLLLEHFYWGSIFLVNLPIVRGRVGRRRLSAAEVEGPGEAAARHRRRVALDRRPALARLRHHRRADRGLGTPADPRRVRGRRGRARRVRLVGAALDSSDARRLQLFKNPRFSAASAGIMLIFFAMFGSTVPAHAVPPEHHGLLRARSRSRAAAVGGDHARRRTAQRAARRAVRNQARRRRPA